MCSAVWIGLFRPHWRSILSNAHGFYNIACPSGVVVELYADIALGIGLGVGIPVKGSAIIPQFWLGALTVVWGIELVGKSNSFHYYPPVPERILCSIIGNSHKLNGHVRLHATTLPVLIERP